MLFTKKSKIAAPAAGLALAALIRIGYWLQIRGEAWFLSPGTDPEFYTGWARAILAGRGGEFLPFPRAPLYAYLLAGVTELFGTGWLPPRLLNLAAELISIFFIYRIGQRLSGISTGCVAALLWAFCGSAVYFSGEILMTSTALALVTVWLYLMLAARERPTFGSAVASGAALGLLCLFRPNFLIFLPFDIIVLYLTAHLFYSPARSTMPVSPSARSTSPISPPTRRGGLKGGYFLLFSALKYPILHLIAALAVISPATVANYISAGRLIPISTQGGVNFYIGNARTATGWSSTLPGAGAAWSETDARRLASAHAGRTLSEVEVSDEFLRMGREEIAADVPAWINLTARKILMLVNLRDIGNNRPLELAWRGSWLLSVMRPLTLGLWLPLALAGWFFTRRSRQTKILAGYSLVFAVTLLMFFITARYRLPLLPPVAVLAAAGLIGIVRNRRNYRELRPAVILGGIGFIAVIPTWGVLPAANNAQAEFMAGNACLRLNRLAEGLKHFHAAAAADSSFPDLNLNLGALDMRLGDTTGAEASFQRELAFHPRNPRALNNLGVTAEHRGLLSDAQAQYNAAYNLNPEEIDFLVNLWRIDMLRGDAFLQQGNLDSARAQYENATVLHLKDARPWHRLAAIAAQENCLRDAAALCRRALAEDPDYAPALALLNVVLRQE